MPGVALGRSSGQSSYELFRDLADSIKDYAIFVLSPDGNVLTWNLDAEALIGYRKQEILGTHCSKFYLPEAIRSGVNLHPRGLAGFHKHRATIRYRRNRGYGFIWKCWPCNLAR